MDSYDDFVFDSLLEVNIAAAKVEANGGEDFVNTTLKKLLRQHALSDKLGVALCHRHFDLKPDERMVEHNNVATPWASDATDRYKNVGLILPLSWVIWEGKLRPYEFYFTLALDEKPLEIPAEFLVDFDEALKVKGLQHTLGLRALRKPTGGTSYRMEFQERFATFTVPWELSKMEQKPNMNIFKTSWTFPLCGHSGSPTDLCGHVECVHCVHPVSICYHST